MLSGAREGVAWRRSLGGRLFPVPPPETGCDGVGVFIVRPGRHGLGVHASRRVSRGASLFQFHGKRISFVEAVAKGEHESYALQIDQNLYVDLDPLGCLVNHSCQPNTGLRSDGWLFALRDIAMGEELRYDYSTTMDEDYWTMPCECGAVRCRRVIRDFVTLPVDVRSKYMQLGAVQAHIVGRYCGSLPSTSDATELKCGSSGFGATNSVG